MEHELKILPQYFNPVVEGTKTFEIRMNDRGFKVGDTMTLQEYDLENIIRVPGGAIGGYTGQEIIKEVTYILEGGQYGLEEGYCILGLKQEGILLKNIDLTGISEGKQWDKMCEEENEFADAYFYYMNNKTEDNKKHVIEELFDEFQAKLGLLEKEGITAEEVQAYYPKHLEKIKDRPRNKEE